MIRKAVWNGDLPPGFVRASLGFWVQLHELIGNDITHIGRND